MVFHSRCSDAGNHNDVDSGGICCCQNSCAIHGGAKKSEGFYWHDAYASQTQTDERLNST